MGPESRWSGYAEFYRASGYAAFPQEHRRSPGRLPFRMITVEQGGHDFTDPSLPETVLALPQRVAGSCTWSWNMGDGWRREAAAPGRMLVVTPDTESRWQVDADRRLLLLVIPSDTIKGILGPATPARLGDGLAPLTAATWEDAFLTALMTRLWSGLLGDAETDSLLADGAITALVSHLLQRSEGQPQAGRAIALPPHRRRRVIAFMEAHLQEDLGLDDLAAVAGMSIRHFARAFRQEMGLTPHGWLMRLRQERAEALLEGSDLSLAEVAAACGFASQSHLTKTFRQTTLLTPRRWRDLRLSKRADRRE
jgi:AraC family transcriptional regulator